MRKVTFALFNHGHASSLLRLSTEANQIFSNFIVGKAIDSIIIGLLTFIGLALLKMPYVVLISFMVGCTNMIPVFGPFIGAIPSAILILLSSGPNKMIYFCIFIIILQQIDGNIIGPKILGNQLGISAFWIMCSVIIGGGLFGVLGMIIAVPIFAFVHLVVSRIINNKLLQKNLSIDVSDYT
jgi:predicted PurR-regulated permease PerM